MEQDLDFLKPIFSPPVSNDKQIVERERHVVEDPGVTKLHREALSSTGSLRAVGSIDSRRKAKLIVDWNGIGGQGPRDGTRDVVHACFPCVRITCATISTEHRALRMSLARGTHTSVFFSATVSASR